MQPLMDWLKTLSHSGLAEWVQADTYAFPGLEATHVISVMLVFGSIAMLDLRLLGFSSKGYAATKINDEVLPWTWAAFAVAAVTGTLLFVGQAPSYVANREFQIKMGLIVLAGVNLGVFHFLTWKDVQQWNNAAPTPRAARIAATISLCCWMGVVIAGRWVGWTLVSH